MAKAVATLTKEFNEASVKVGENFDIELPIGGFIGQAWNKVQVVSGDATLVRSPAKASGGCTGPLSVTWTFKAEKAGDVEIVATPKFGTNSTFKVHVS